MDGSDLAANEGCKKMSSWSSPTQNIQKWNMEPGNNDVSILFHLFDMCVFTIPQTYSLYSNIDFMVLLYIDVRNFIFVIIFINSILSILHSTYLRRYSLWLVDCVHCFTQIYTAIWWCIAEKPIWTYCRYIMTEWTSTWITCNYYLKWWNANYWIVGGICIWKLLICA